MFFVKNGKSKSMQWNCYKLSFATAGSMCYCLSSTDGKAVTVNEVDGLCGCSHEEADTRLLLHAAHAADIWRVISVKITPASLSVRPTSLSVRPT